RLKGTPEAVLQNPELMDLVLPRIQADFCAYETYDYRSEEPLACPISVMGGVSDSSVCRSELQAWSAHTSQDFRVRLFPGDHFFIHSARGLVMWAIRQDLATPLRKAS